MVLAWVRIQVRTVSIDRKSTRQLRAFSINCTLSAISEALEARRKALWFWVCSKTISSHSAFFGSKSGKPFKPSLSFTANSIKGVLLGSKKDINPRCSDLGKVGDHFSGDITHTVIAPSAWDIQMSPLRKCRTDTHKIIYSGLMQKASKFGYG